MPIMTNQPKSINDRSSLTDGWHPGYLLAITDEATPESWKMAEKSPRMWRWTFAVWQQPGDILRDAGERQSAVSSQAFSPKGRNPASKAYAWTAALLQRQIGMGESVDLDPMMPIPCRVKIQRNAEYANIIDIEAWPEGPRSRDVIDICAAILARDGSAPPRDTLTAPQQQGLANMPQSTSRW